MVKGSELTPRARQMSKLLLGWERSGVSLREFCLSRRVNYNTMAWWRRQLQQRERVDQSSSYRTELVEITPSALAAPSGSFELSLPNGITLRVPMRFEVGALGELLELVRRC